MLSGRVLDSRPRGLGFEPHQRHCVVSLSKNINASLVLVQPRMTHLYITERLLMGRKESNQTNKLIGWFISSLISLFTKSKSSFSVSSIFVACSLFFLKYLYNSSSRAWTSSFLFCVFIVFKYFLGLVLFSFRISFIFLSLYVRCVLIVLS